MYLTEQNIPGEILFYIEMESYMEYNDVIANMYNYLGDIYSLKDIKEVEKAQKQFETKIKEDYLGGKRKYSEEDIVKIKEWLK